MSAKIIAATGKLLALALCGTTLLPAAEAGELVHRVAAGESASAIAKRYWGAYELVDRLLLHNGKASTRLQIGDRLRVPYADVHRVVSGESWSALAARYLGRGSGWRFLAALNGSDGRGSLQVDQVVEIPVVTRHSLQAGQTLSRLAETYYGDKRRAGLLAEFNDVDDPARLAIGTPIDVPWIAPRRVDQRLQRPQAASPAVASRSQAARASEPAMPVPGPPPSPIAKPAAGPVERPASGLRAEIAAAAVTFERGEYERVQTFLQALCDDVGLDGTRADRAAYWRLRSFIEVAFDRPRQACHAHRHALRSGAGTDFVPDQISPKIRRILADCSLEQGA